ncbi:MAG: ABC transporter permease [Saccharofermentanales bacterium]|jgi:osmoprotectant transport system permease protein
MIIDVLRLYADRSDFFIQLFWEHIVLTVISILIITAIGISLGILMTKSWRLARVVLTFTSFLYTIPSIALFGFLVAITGIGSRSAIIALVMYGLLPVIRNTYSGIMEVPSQIVESAVAMGSTNNQLLFKVQLPLALPIIITGFRTMVIMTISLGGVASFIGAGGLGVAIWRGITTNFQEMTIAGSLLVALLAIFADLLLARVEALIKLRVLGRKATGGRKHA